MEAAEEGNYNYEDKRQKLKLGSFATCAMIFKATVGVGIFTFQYCFALVRLILKGSAGLFGELC